MPINLKLRQLEGFVVAADEKSFVRAASTLAMTPPAFSQLIRDLENAVGVALFERTTRSVELTATGEQFLSLIRRPIEDIAEAQQWIKDVASGRRGKIAFAALHSIAFGIGIETVASFNREHPDVDVKMVEEQNELLLQKVLNRQVDFGLGMFTHTIKGLQFEKLLEDDLVAVLPHRHKLARKTAISWQDLAATPLILLQPGSSVRNLVEAGLVVANTPREKTVEASSMVSALNMVNAGLGITVLPRLSLSSLRTDGLVARPIGPPAPTRIVGVVRVADRPESTAETAFLARLRSVASRLQDEGALDRL
ncbi:LysR family transcriptional regulator [Paraburkholderia tropica]|uniref:LysR family transcriptional regulator n=1 Tax=Paraburkholderia tropica TaxID=92647 RepID=UPI002AB0357C|nr:LysR family transcriptional regulator [Paraburkholderia tropica]